MLLLTNGRLFDGTGAEPRDGAWLLIDGERIAEIGAPGQAPPDAPGATVLDLAGQTMMPGLINTHVHFQMDGSGDTWRRLSTESDELLTLRTVKVAERILRAGVTSVVDLGNKGDGALALRQAIDEGLFPGPRIQAARRALCMTGGHARLAGSREVDGIPQMLRAARYELDRGAELIKFMASSGMHAPPGVPVGAAELTAEEMAAGVQVAHVRGRKARAHAISNLSVKNALRAGMDTVEHGPFLDEEAIDLFLRTGATFVPTIVAYYQIMTHGGQGAVSHHAAHMAGEVHRQHLETVGRAYEAGVKMAVGTDAGSPFNPHDDIVRELEFMAQAGVPTGEVLVMATRHGAETMSRDADLGTLEPGKLADIITVAGDPLSDLGVLRDVHLVIKGGAVVKQSGPNPS